MILYIDESCNDCKAVLQHLLDNKLTIEIRNKTNDIEVTPTLQLGVFHKIVGSSNIIKFLKNARI